MSNNRNQKVNSFLNSITQRELDEYVKSNNIHNKNVYKLLDRIKHNQAETHINEILKKNSNKLEMTVNSIYKSGQAFIIAFVLECFYNEKYKISDVQLYLKSFFKDDIELKEMVYDIMKDF